MRVVRLALADGRVHGHHDKRVRRVGLWQDEEPLHRAVADLEVLRLADQVERRQMHLNLKAAARVEDGNVGEGAHRVVGGRGAGVGVLQNLVQQVLCRGYVLALKNVVCLRHMERDLAQHVGVVVHHGVVGVELHHHVVLGLLRLADVTQRQLQRHALINGEHEGAIVYGESPPIVPSNRHGQVLYLLAKLVLAYVTQRIKVLLPEPQKIGGRSIFRADAQLTHPRVLGPE
mmetsp:Transcript_34614/g.102753  ORF Transcript_34614/g.102753 Transcript_34614/m.102753 type:complete len:231 (-) Transcript_34614:130-822(-)